MINQEKKALRAEYKALRNAVADIEAEYALNVAKFDSKTEESADLYAAKVLDMVVISTGNESVDKELENVLKSQYGFAFTAGEIAAAGRFIEPEEEDDTTGTTGSTSNTLSVDKNTVVAVTYGDVVTDATGTTKTAYKTFLLNYNSYAVKLTYDGVLYTIPAGGCIAIYE